MRVLIVEDDGVARRHALASATGLGFEVETAEDAESAWALHVARPYDVIVTDWLLPGMSGVELCRRVDAMRAQHFTYLVLVTCKRTDADLAQGIEAGADDFLAKPYRRVELHARLAAGARMTRFVSRLCPGCQEVHAAGEHRSVA